MIKTSYATFISAICMVFITWFFSKSMDNTWAENKMLKERISELETKYTNKIAYQVTVTTYNPTIRCIKFNIMGASIPSNIYCIIILKPLSYFFYLV